MLWTQYLSMQRSVIYLSFPLTEIISIILLGYYDTVLDIP